MSKLFTDAPSSSVLLGRVLGSNSPSPIIPDGVKVRMLDAYKTSHCQALRRLHKTVSMPLCIPGFTHQWAFFGAFSEKMLVACLWVSPPTFSNVGMVFNAVTRPDYQNRGIMAALIQYAVYWCENNTKLLELQVRCNANSVNVFKRSGFTEKE